VHLYNAIKKAMFKIGAFCKGFLIPLAKDATSREAIIVGSIINKMSINNLDAAATLLKLTEYDYDLGVGYFIKVLIGKKYSLPTIVLEQVINYFCQYGLNEDGDELEEELQEMPVMWH
jgi:essential nuclear protein 1